MKSKARSNGQFLALGILALVTGALYGLPSYALAAELTKQFTVRPLRMTYEDLEVIFRLVDTVIMNSGEAWQKDARAERGPAAKIVIARGEDSYSLTREMAVSKVQALPEIATSVHYQYGHFGREGAISRVEIWLTDSRRQVTIEGRDSAQVDLLAIALRDKLGVYTTRFGGSGFRFLMFYVAMLVSWIGGSMLAIGYADRHKGPNPLVPALIAGACVFAFVLAVIEWLPWDEWFSGVAVYRGTASFIDRNINVISFVAIIGGLAGTLVKVAWKYGLRDAFSRNRAVREE